MINNYNHLLKILISMLSLTIILINLYALINNFTLFSVDIITNILFVIIFALLGIKSIKDKTKIGYLYFAFIIVMAIIFFIKLMTKI